MCCSASDNSLPYTPITAASASYIFRYVCSLTKTSSDSTPKNLLQEGKARHANAAYRPYRVIRFIFMILIMFILLTIILKSSFDTHLYCPELRCHTNIDTLAIDRAVGTKFRIIS